MRFANTTDLKKKIGEFYPNITVSRYFIIIIIIIIILS